MNSPQLTLDDVAMPDSSTESGPLNPPSRGSQYWNNYDLAVFLLILGLGVLQFALVRRAADYLNDTNYYELFKSVANHQQYGFNSKPMTQLPPGLPYVLAGLSVVIGS